MSERLAKTPRDVAVAEINRVSRRTQLFPFVAAGGIAVGAIIGNATDKPIATVAGAASAGVAAVAERRQAEIQCRSAIKEYQNTKRRGLGFDGDPAEIPQLYKDTNHSGKGSLDPDKVPVGSAVLYAVSSWGGGSCLGKWVEGSLAYSGNTCPAVAASVAVAGVGVGMSRHHARKMQGEALERLDEIGGSSTDTPAA